MSAPPVFPPSTGRCIDGLPAAWLEIHDTGTAKGRGVYARRHFAAGEEVEAAPVLVLKGEFDELPELLKTYVFNWESLAGIPGTHAIALGFGSLYNHDNPASLCYRADARAAVMRFVAARDIAAGEELTINYNADGGVNEWPDDNWFERHDIARIVG